MTETILVTGSNRGIGLELAHQYAAQGWQVLACCRRPDQATALIRLGDKFPGDGAPGGTVSFHVPRRSP
jgi:NAD(P)-dependent dehydrogenase (short-subunit alcohol dehydrogenase family)